MDWEKVCSIRAKESGFAPPLWAAACPAAFCQALREFCSEESRLVLEVPVLGSSWVAGEALDWADAGFGFPVAASDVF